MSPVRFYIKSLFTPMIAPFLAIPFIGGRSFEGLIPVLAPFAMMVVMVGVAGALPYIVIVVPLRSGCVGGPYPKSDVHVSSLLCS